MIHSSQNLSKGFRILILIAFFLSFSPPHPAKAAGIVVDTLGYYTGTNGYCSLDEAIYAANNDTTVDTCTAGSGNDTITFSVSGEITIIGTIFPTGPVTIDGGNQITLSGSSNPFFNVKNGNTLGLANIELTGTNTGIHIEGGSTVNVSSVEFSNFAKVLDITNSTVYISTSTFDANKLILTAENDSGTNPYVKIQDSTFSNATGIASSDQLFMLDGFLEISDSTFSNNPNSSWIYTYNAGLNLTNVTFRNNAESFDGGAAIRNGGNAMITRSTFENNVSNNGYILGPTIQNEGTMQIDQSVFLNNGGTSDSGNVFGGAVSNSDGILTITNSFFSGNYAGEYNNPNAAMKTGGAVYSANGTLNISNSTFTGNSSENGAAVYASSGQLTAINNTFYNNKISTRDYPMNAGTIAGNPSPAYLFNNIVKEETGLSGYTTRFPCLLTPSLSSGNYATDSSCGFTQVDSDVLVLGVLSGSGAAQHFPLLPGNPAIDGGSNANCTAADIRGVVRPQGSACDPGAYESRAFTLTQTGGNNQSTMINTAFSDPLTLSVNSSFGDAVEGGLVTFTAPSSGASTTSAPTISANISSGVVSLPVTANSIEGTYTVSAGTIGGNTTYSYGLTNMDPPTLSSISASGTNPTGAASIVFTVTFSESVSGVDVSDFSLVTTGTALGDIYTVGGSGTTYTVTVNNVSGTGTIGLNLVDDDSIIDILSFPLGGAGDNNGNFTGGSYTVDRDAPIVVSIVRVNSNPVQAGTSVDFTVTFSESVSSVDATDFILTTTGGISGAAIGTPTGSGDTWTVPVSVGSASGTIRLDVPGSATIYDAIGNQVAAFSAGETYTVDSDRPQITSINRVSSSPTANASVEFTVQFNEPVTGVDAADFELTRTGSLSGVSIDSVSSGTDSFTVTVDTGTGSGELRLDVADTATIQDASGLNLQGLPYTSGDVYVLDRETAHVTSIMRHSSGSPTKLTTLEFSVTFGEDVLLVDLADFQLNLSGTVTGTLDSVVAYIPSHIFVVTVTGVSGTGELNLGFAPGFTIEDNFGNVFPPEPIIDQQEGFFVDNSGIKVIGDGLSAMPGEDVIINGQSYTQLFTSLNIRFDEDAYNPPGHSATDDVTNPNNYLLLQAGLNETYDTTTCLQFAGNGNKPLDDDIQISTDPVTYENNGGNGPYVATITLNNGTPLPKGSYRLLVCGTTSIYDTLGNELNDGLDSIYNFSLTDPQTLPETGFAPQKITNLSAREAFYADMDGLSLEIPKLNLVETIVGVPADEDNWDIRWLGENIGWLSGTAYPTWEGNTVLTGHLYDADGMAGPFVKLNTLDWGDQIIIHANGMDYIYEVRTVIERVNPQDTTWITRHESKDWITLVTCSNCVVCQVEIEFFGKASSGCQYVISRIIEFKMVRTLRMQATKATFGGLPLSINFR